MDRTQPVTLQRFQFAWAEKTVPRKQLQMRLTETMENKKIPTQFRNRFKSFLIRLRSD